MFQDLLFSCFFFWILFLKSFTLSFILLLSDMHFLTNTFFYLYLTFKLSHTCYKINGKHMIYVLTIFWQMLRYNGIYLSVRACKLRFAYFLFNIFDYFTSWHFKQNALLCNNINWIASYTSVYFSEFIERLLFFDDKLKYWINLT